MESNRQITSEEDVRKLIHSGQWSQHRKRVVRRAVVAGVAVVALPLATIGLLRQDGLGASSSGPMVASVETPMSVHAPQEQPQQVEPAVKNRAHNTTVIAKNAEPRQETAVLDSETQPASAQPPQEFAMASEQPQVERPDILAEFQETEYSMIVWNDYSEADTIVDRLNHFLIKKGV